MKKLIVMLAVILCFSMAMPAHAEDGSFNEQSYNKVTALSQAIESFRTVSAEGELSVLATRVEAIQKKAVALGSYNIAAEAAGSNDYQKAADDLKQAATKLEAVSKKMAQAAVSEDDMLFVSYQKEYNGAVTAFNNAIKTYATATEKAAETIRFEQMAIIGTAVLTGILTIALWFWAAANDETNKPRARARRWVAIASLLPFLGALLVIGLYLSHMISGYTVWLPTAAGLVALLIVWIIYFIRRRRFT